MKAIVFVGHGGLPQGMKDSVSMITGATEHLFAVSLLPEDGKAEFRKKLDELDQLLTGYDGILFFADVLGGSPCNGLVEKYFNDKKAQIITGMNLPLALAAVMGDLSNNAIIGEGIAGITDLKESNNKEKKPNEMKEKVESSKEGQKPFVIKNVRVDARGIHGQVATAWTPKLSIDRIIVIDDIAVKDEMQKMALKMAKPNSVKLSVLSTKRAVERLSQKASYPDEKLLIIIQRIDTLQRLSELGFYFDEINMGNVPNRVDTKAYRKTVHLTEQEVKVIQKLIQQGTDFTAQMVPNDPKVDFNEIINK